MPSPVSLARRRMRAPSCARTGGARPTAGSSRRSSGGSVASARTISTMRCWPPESSRAGRSSRWRISMRSRRRRARSVAARSTARARFAPRTTPATPLAIVACRPQRTFSSAVSSPKRPPFWKVRRMPRAAISCGARFWISSPRKRMRPAAIAALPVTALKSVVLPAPLGPMRAQTSPAATAKETASTALRPPKRTVTSARSRRGAASAVIILVAEDGVEPRQQARQPARQEEDDEDDEEAEDQLLEPREIGEDLRRRRDDDGAEHGAGEAGEPTHHDDRELQDELDEVEGIRREMADEQAAPCEAEHETAARRDAHGRGRGLVVLDRHEGAADARAQEPVGRDHRRRGEGEEDIEFAPLGRERPAEDIGARHRHAHRAAGQALESDIAPAHEFAEGQGHDREVEGADAAQRRHAGGATGEGAHDAGGRQGRPPGQPELQHEDARGVGADAEEGDVREGELAEIADDEVEADADRNIDQHQIDDVLLVLVEEGRQGEEQRRKEQEAAAGAARGGLARHVASDPPCRRPPEEALRTDEKDEDGDDIGGDVDEGRRDVESEQLLHDAEKDSADR